MLRQNPPKHCAPIPGLRGRLNEVVFGIDTWAGRFFDIAVIIVIGLSVSVDMLESVGGIRESFARELFLAGWPFTMAFTVEYGLRVYSARTRVTYIVSLCGLVDFLGHDADAVFCKRCGGRL